MNVVTVTLATVTVLAMDAAEYTAEHAEVRPPLSGKLRVEVDGLQYFYQIVKDPEYGHLS